MKCPNSRNKKILQASKKNMQRQDSGGNMEARFKSPQIPLYKNTKGMLKALEETINSQ